MGKVLFFVFIIEIAITMVELLSFIHYESLMKIRDKNEMKVR